MKSILYCLLLLCSLPAFSQGKKNKTLPPPLEINPYGQDVISTTWPYNTMVKFKINNVNPFKVDGSSSAEKKSIDFEVPAQFTAVTAGKEEQGFVESGQSELKELEEEKKETESALALTKTNVGRLANIINNKSFSANNTTAAKARAQKAAQEKLIKELEEKIKKLEAEMEVLKKILEEKNALAEAKDHFVENYNCFIAALNRLNLYVTIDEYLSSQLQETFIPDVEAFTDNFKNYIKSINNNSEDANRIRQSALETLNQLTGCYIGAKRAYEEMGKHVKAEKVTLAGGLATKDKSVEIKIDSAFVVLALKKFFEEEFKFITDKFNIIAPEKKRTEIINKINDGISRYNKIINAKYYVYTDAQQLDDDMVTITPKLKNSKGEVLKEFTPVKITTTGGLKVDFSSGYFLSFRGDDNYTNLYDTSGIIGLQKNESDDLRHAIGALINVYPRWASKFSPGFSVGISLPTDNARVGFCAGISALMLEKNRLVLTAGVSYNRTKILNTANLVRDEVLEKQTGKETYRFANNDYKEVKYDELYRPSFFVGITYNIFSVKK